MLNKLQTLWNNRYDYCNIHGRPLIKLALLAYQVNRFYKDFGANISDPYTTDKRNYRIVPANLEADYFLINSIRFDIFCITEEYENSFDNHPFADKHPARTYLWLAILNRALKARKDYILESEDTDF